MTITRTMPRLNPFDAGEVDPDRGRMRVKVVTEIEILEILATHVIENLATHEIETEIPATATAIPDPRSSRRPRGGRGRDRDQDGNGEATRQRHNVPTWIDTVELLVNANIENHKKNKGGRGRGGRKRS
jgi:hypothetical protein